MEIVIAVLSTGLYQNIFGILFKRLRNHITLLSRTSSSAVLNICSMLLKVLKWPGKGGGCHYKKSNLKGHLLFKQQKIFFRGHCPGSGAFLIPGSEIQDPRSGIWDPGSEIRDLRSGIRDPDGKKSGSGVRDNLPGSPTLWEAKQLSM